MNRVKPFSPSTKPVTAAAHDDIGAMIHTGAAVASIRYASFVRFTPLASAKGDITLPTVRQLK